MSSEVNQKTHRVPGGLTAGPVTSSEADAAVCGDPAGDRRIGGILFPGHCTGQGLKISFNGVPEYRITIVLTQEKLNFKNLLT